MAILAKEIKIAEAEPYIKKLGLQWSIKFVALPPGDPGLTFESPTIACFPERQAHEVHFSSQWFRTLCHKYDIVHELGHAKLAEAIDPLFATARFHRDCHHLLDNKKISDSLDMLTWPADVWGDELLWQIDRAIIKEAIKSFFERAGITLRHLSQESHRAQRNNGLQRSLLFTGTVNHGRLIRLGLWPEYEKKAEAIAQLIDLVYGLEQGTLFRKLGNYFARMPGLNFKNKNDSLKILERTVQEMMEILGLPLLAKIVDWKGRAVWLLERRGNG